MKLQGNKNIALIVGLKIIITGVRGKESSWMKGLSARRETSNWFGCSICPAVVSFTHCITSGGARIACWQECQTRDRKVTSLNPGRSGGRIFLSRVNFVCWLLFSDCFTPVLPQWHVKDPSHSAKSAGGRLHLNMHTPFTQQSHSGLTMPLSRHSAETYPETSSHATCQGTFSDSATVVSACWATVDWFWPKEWN